VNVRLKTCCLQEAGTRVNAGIFEMEKTCTEHTLPLLSVLKLQGDAV
jgi:hypothetical protein